MFKLSYPSYQTAPALFLQGMVCEACLVIKRGRTVVRGDLPVLSEADSAFHPTTAKYALVQRTECRQMNLTKAIDNVFWLKLFNGIKHL